MKEPRPNADEQRERRFAEVMSNRYSWRSLTGEQIEQILEMAEEIHVFMDRARKKRQQRP